MNLISRLSVIALGAMVGGCATHPLPEDFSRTTTRDLVQAVRCELAEGVVNLRNVDRPQLETALVAVEFKLYMDEANNATSGKLSLADPITGGSVAIDLTGSAEKSRSNERSFRIVDTFAVLKKIDGDPQCKERSKHANFIYPVAGRIGLDEVVSTYWDVKSLTTIKPVGNALPFTDKIIFKTKLSAGINPTIKLSSNSASLHLTNVSVNGAVIREDKHQLTVAMTNLAPQTDAKKPNRPPSKGGKSDKSVRQFRVPEDSFTTQESYSTTPDLKGAVDTLMRQLDDEREADRFKGLELFRD